MPIFNITSKPGDQPKLVCYGANKGIVIKHVSGGDMHLKNAAGTVVYLLLIGETTVVYDTIYAVEYNPGKGGLVTTIKCLTL